MSESYTILITYLILLAFSELGYGVYIAISRRHYRDLVQKYRRENHESDTTDRSRSIAG